MTSREEAIKQLIKEQLRKAAFGLSGSKSTLVEQPRGKELEYRIIAVNKAGDGEPGNTATVVL